MPNVLCYYLDPLWMILVFSYKVSLVSFQVVLPSWGQNVVQTEVHACDIYSQEKKVTSNLLNKFLIDKKCLTLFFNCLQCAHKSCPKGGFPSLKHNEIRDLIANLLTEICSI